MLAIHRYRFLIGTKIPFTQFPGIVHSFLQQQNLEYKQFLYYFEDSFGALPKIQKDCPSVGPVRSRTVKNREEFYISNIEASTPCTHDEIMALIPRIHKRYGFSETHLIYQDVNFFSRNIPGITNSPGNTPSCLKSTSITCYRDSVFPCWSSIDLQLVIYDGEQLFDPTPYLEAMKQLLPGIRYMQSVECCMTPSEQAVYDALNGDAEPMLQQARTLFKDRLPEISLTASPPFIPKFSAAPVVKKLCKQFGYTYVDYHYNTFFFQKRTKNGHYILPDIDIGPMLKAVTITVRFKGVGFEHWLGSTYRQPQSQEELEQELLQFFQALSAFEQELLPALDAHFPQTPAWFK